MIDAKEYLKDIKRMRQHLDRLKQRRASLHLDVSFGGIDYSADRIQNSPENKLENAMIKLSDRLEHIDQAIALLSVDIDDRLNNIENLKDNKYRNVLFKRYSEYKSLEEISVEMGYVYNYTCNIHGEALKELSKVLNKS